MVTSSSASQHLAPDALSSETDPFKVLNLKRDASPEEATKAYRRCMRLYHPDLAPESDRDERQKAASRINEAIQQVRDGWIPPSSKPKPDPTEKSRSTPDPAAYAPPPPPKTSQFQYDQPRYTTPTPEKAPSPSSDEFSTTPLPEEERERLRRSRLRSVFSPDYSRGDRHGRPSRTQRKRPKLEVKPTAVWIVGPATIFLAVGFLMQWIRESELTREVLDDFQIGIDLVELTRIQWAVGAGIVAVVLLILSKKLATGYVAMGHYPSVALYGSILLLATLPEMIFLHPLVILMIPLFSLWGYLAYRLRIRRALKQSERLQRRSERV